MIKKNLLSPPTAGAAWSRELLIDLLNIAAAVNEYGFIRQAAINWLAVYPGDLQVQLYHAQALHREGFPEQARSQVESICLRDPENLAAQQLRASFLNSLKELNAISLGELYALHPKNRRFRMEKPPLEIPQWAKLLVEIRAALVEGTLEQAARQLPDLLGANPASPLAALTHLEVLRADTATPETALLQMAEHYSKRWPETIGCSLLLADALNQAGKSDQAVRLLHKAASQDVAGQVPDRIWGANFSYRSLWPNSLQAHIEARIPAAAAAALGWNQLPAGPAGENTTTDPKNSAAPESLEPQDVDLDAHLDEDLEAIRSLSPETLQSIEDELEDMVDTLGAKGAGRADGRFPMYVVFSTRKGLENKYGPETTEILIDEMKKATYAVRLKPGWGAVMVLPDDPSSMANFGLKPTLSDDPWALKLALADLDEALAENGLMIGALLIVGDHNVVPFHHLPNPVEDVDAHVPSDNPYATIDENYFIPEWPVGRLPGGAGSDPGLLLDLLRRVADHHMGKPKNALTLWEQFIAWLARIFSGTRPANRSFGYVAEAWEKASQDVFKSIQDHGNLVTSPPFGKHAEIPVPVTRLGYFNLHGVEDSAGWYGQKDLTNGSAGPDYPIALRPQDINEYEDAPLFVFTEACYGVHLDGRAVEDSIALKYLSRGSHAVIGSTVTAYGSVAAPLIAADLLAEKYWQLIDRGYASGIALQHAKVKMAEEMNKRQGYLDGEDQKTLVSFIHFGDPLASPQTAKRKQPKSAWVPRTDPVQVKTVCDRSSLTTDIPSETLKQVKRVVKRYLPGMEGAEMLLGIEHDVCQGESHQCATAQFGTKVHSKHLHQRKVVTLSKQFEIPQNSGKTIHRHYARVTFDQSGRMVKLAVSR